jgi:ABC-type Zn uptake system ZnuABC Zn-binding protein ZnuA
LTLALAACSGDTSTPGDADPAGSPEESSAPPELAVVGTTTIWADVTSAALCGLEVAAVIPPGADPHTFETSLADRAVLESADLVVANGLALEEGLTDLLATVANGGTPVIEMTEAVEIREMDDDHHDDHESDDHDEHKSEDHDDHESDDHDDHESDDHDEHKSDDHDEHKSEDHDDHESDDHDEHDDHDSDDHESDDHDEHDDHESGDHDDHDHSGGDPHIWLDPLSVADAVPAIIEAAIAAGADTSVRACGQDYIDELEALDGEIRATLAVIRDDARYLVTNHDAFGYFANRYDFEVVGTVIPSLSTLAETNPADLADLAAVIEELDIPTVFSEEQTSARDAEALADAIPGLTVVALDTGSLRDGNDDYLSMMRRNVTAISEALG